MKVWLIGENNPHGPGDEYALFPFPKQSAGGRLCRRILEMTPRVYLATFERRNLLQSFKWSVPKAREAARQLLEEAGPGSRMILFGAKVSRAFGLPATPFVVHQININFDMATGETSIGATLTVLPHPSGRCRVWTNELGSEQLAGRYIMEQNAALEGTHEAT